MSLKRPLLVVLAAFISFGAAFAQSLAVTSNTPKTDGVISGDEYSYVKDLGKMKIYLDRNADTLFVGVVGNTTGWVSVGLGSLVMNQSDIFMGFIADGKPQFKPQLGTGHSHQDVGDSSLADTVVSYAVKQDGGKTILEMAFKASGYIEKGQSALDLIYAVGPSPNFMMMHSFRGSLKVPLE